MKLSKRLCAVAGLVTEGASVADIGTDHGYVPIYLMRKGIVKRAVAMDVREGPLEKAKAHIRECGLENRIQTRISDGLSALAQGEADTVILAGMGGGLMIRILESGWEHMKEIRALILQPQSEIDKVRRFVILRGLTIDEEDMVEDAGKYYTVMRVASGEAKPYTPEEYLYGRNLLESGNPALYNYLQRELTVKNEILERLARKGSERAVQRSAQIEEERRLVKRALKRYEFY